MQLRCEEKNTGPHNFIPLPVVFLNKERESLFGIVEGKNITIFYRALFQAVKSGALSS